MFRLWGKIITDSHIKKSETIERPEEDTRTHKVLHALEDLCHLWDLSNPIWLDSTIRDFKAHRKARFYAENFIDEIDFDYLEIQVIEE